MSTAAPSATPVTLTVLIRNDCPTCKDLLRQLNSVWGIENIELKTVELNSENPPLFAQGVIVPATYIGEQLWRYGLYSRSKLEARLAKELGESGTQI